MSESRIVVPGALLQVACDATNNKRNVTMEAGLEAVLRWLRLEGYKLLEIEQLGGLAHKSGLNETQVQSLVRAALIEMFALEPEMDDPLNGLLSRHMPETTKSVGCALHDELIKEAYRRGQKK